MNQSPVCSFTRSWENSGRWAFRVWLSAASVGLMLAVAPHLAQAAPEEDPSAPPAKPHTSRASSTTAAAPQLPAEPVQAAVEYVIALAREAAPEVLVSRANLNTSQAALVGARVAPLGNPYLELTAERGTRGVTRDAEIRSSLTLPVEIAGQRGSRIAEAKSWIAFHGTELEYWRSQAAGKAVQAWGMAVGESARLLVAEDLVRSAMAELDHLRARHEVKDVTDQPLRLAELELGRQIVLREEVASQRERALGYLTEATGVVWRSVSFPTARPPWHQIPVEDPERLVRDAPAVRSHQAEAAFHENSIKRYRRERWMPLNVILSAGRGDIGEARVGIGLGTSLPLVRRQQGELARADGERSRALVKAQVAQKTLSVRLDTIRRELAATHQALESLEKVAHPAASAALVAATDLARLGKSEYLTVLLARRELNSLALRRLDLIEREWSLLGEWVSATGRLP